MVQIKRSEMRQVDDAFAMGSGYVLNFSDRTMSEWFDDELRINIDDQRYNAAALPKRTDCGRSLRTSLLLSSHACCARCGLTVR